MRLRFSLLLPLLISSALAQPAHQSPATKKEIKKFCSHVTIYAAGDIADCRKNRPRNQSPHAPQI
jgi:NADH dehydrogenase FAD-containing subunit